MRNLPCPARILARDHLANALGMQDGNEKQFTPQQIDKIMEVYDEYDAAYGAPSEGFKGDSLDDALRAAVRNAYDLTQKKRRLSHIRDDLMQGVERCPYCGIQAPNQLDHYLPRSVFHPLAIYVRNLIPVCSVCNHSKGKEVADKAEHRFLHTYLEDLRDVRFLYATAEILDDGLVVEYFVDPDAGLSNQLLLRLDYQLSRLDLNARYGCEINIVLSNHFIALRSCHEAGGLEGVQQFLSDQSEQEFRLFHKNYWRPVLLSALHANAEFCDGGFYQILDPHGTLNWDA